MIAFGVYILWLALLWSLRGFFCQAWISLEGENSKRIDFLQNRLHQNFVFKERHKIHNVAIALVGVGTCFSIFIFSWIPVVSSLTIYFLFPRVWIYYVEYSRNRKFQKQLLLLIPLLSSMLRTGHSLEKSFSEAKKTIGAPMSEEIQFMLNEMKLGSTLEKSIEKLVTRFYSENLLTLSHAIMISRKLGTSLTEAMDHISESILQKEKLKQQIYSLTSQGRMQAYVAVCMPFFIGLALKFISPDYFSPLFHTSIGKIAVAYGICSIMFGLFWIHRIVSKEYL